MRERKPKVPAALAYLGWGQRKRDEAERVCIRLICERCRAGDFPGFHPDPLLGGGWWEHGSPYEDCRATAIYEYIRERTERGQQR